MKRTSILLIIIGLFLSGTIFAKSNTFSDVAGKDWFSDDVHQLASKEIIGGFPDGTFRPNKSLTVEQMVVMILRSIGEKEAVVATHHWSDGYIQRAKELGIILDGEFDTYQRDITRGEISRMILRGVQINYPDNYKAYRHRITDINKMDAVWEEIALKIYTAGIVSGYPDGTFRLQGRATRAEAATILNRVVDQRRRVTLVPVEGTKVQERIQALKNQWAINQPKHEGAILSAQPKLQPPYEVGRLHPATKKDIEHIVKYIRCLSGLSQTVYVSDTASYSAQQGAVLLAVSNFSHTPVQPANMSDSFYQQALIGTSTSNISYNAFYASSANNHRKDVNPTVVIQRFMQDSDSHNMGVLGHRRWILAPQLKEFGYGYVEKSATREYFGVMKVFGQMEKEQQPYEQIFWPSATAFPTRFMMTDTPWSVSLNPTIYDAHKTDQIQVVLTKINTGQTWKLDKTAKNKKGAYFNIETSGYGVAFCIIFRPDPQTLTGYKNGERYKVTITNIYKKDGTQISIDYETEFFDL